MPRAAVGKTGKKDRTGAGDEEDKIDMEAARRAVVDFNSLLNQELDDFIFAEEEFVKSKNKNAERAAQREKL
ncbi:MAG: hypothetical protein SGPRY_006837 [Prymnesium sp.]